MSALDQARADILKISTDPNGFNSSATFIARTGETATIVVINNTIGRKLDSNTGLIINGKNASVVFAESAMPLSYPIRNSSGAVSMIGDRISVPDSTGVIKDYIVQENIPDESVGLITLLLGNWE